MQQSEFDSQPIKSLAAKAMSGLNQSARRMKANGRSRRAPVEDINLKNSISLVSFCFKYFLAGKTGEMGPEWKQFVGFKSDRSTGLLFF